MNVRVTQRSMTRQYMSNTNTALSQMNKISNKILTKRKFVRASENPTGAAKALNVRKNLANLDMYEDNLNTAKGIFSSAETSLLSVSNNVSAITDKLVYGANDTQGQEQKNIIANEIEQVANEMMNQMNNDYSERRLFGGTNNSGPAFTVENGVLSYNGVPVNSKVESTSVTNPDGSVTTTYTFGGEEITEEQAKLKGYQLFPSSKPILIDVGIGIKYDDEGNVDDQTALDISLNGAKLTGNGVDEDGDSQNLIQLCFDAATALKNGDKSKVYSLIDKIKNAQDTLLVGITDLGIQEQAVDFYLTKVDDDRTTLSEAQVTVEGMTDLDLAEAITEFKTVESAYNATLQMGSKVVPTSIFDFIR